LDELPVKAGEDVARRIREIEKREEKKEKLKASIHNNELDYKIRRTTQKKSYDETKNELERALQAVDDELESLVAELVDFL